MKNVVKFLAYGLLLTALAITSCSKEGPQGPPGIAGTNGNDGTSGADGQDGTNGNDGQDGQDGQDGISNIITSDWFEAAWPLPADRGTYEATVPALTQEIVDQGVIMVYLSFLGVAQPLPISYENGTTYNFFANEGKLFISFSADAPLTSTPTFRYVLIPTSNTSGKNSSGGKGNVLAELKAKGVDINDYYAMMDYLGKDY